LKELASFKFMSCNSIDLTTPNRKLNWDVGKENFKISVMLTLKDDLDKPL